jgi:hypothetical protein
MNRKSPRSDKHTPRSAGTEYNNYSTHDLACAIDSTFTPRKLSVSAASNEFHVPYNSLKRYKQQVEDKSFTTPVIERKYRITQYLLHQRQLSQEKKKKLSIEMEQKLVDHIVSEAEAGRPMNELEIRIYAGRMADTSSAEADSLSYTWFNDFLNRNNHLSMRTSSKLTYSRAKALNPETVKHFFSYLKQLYDRFSLTADRVFNMDEKGFDGEAARKKKVCAPKSMKHINTVQSNFREHWSVECIASASGLVCPPLFVFKGELTPVTILNGANLGSMVAMQENGYFTKEVLPQVLNHLLKYTENVLKPVLLILDGSSTHLDSAALEAASEKGIEILCLPANTTHRLQPLDVSVFGPLSTYWATACSRFRLDRGYSISKYDVCSLFAEPWTTATSVKNIQAGFRNCGIWPFDPSKITISDMVPSQKYKPNQKLNENHYPIYLRL